MYKKQLSVTIYILVYILFTAVTHAGVKEGNTVFLSLPLQENHSMNYIQEVKDGNFFLDKDDEFTVKAFVAPKKVKYFVFDGKSLLASSDTVLCSKDNCTRNWSFDLSEQSLSIVEYPRLRINYKKVLPKTPVQVEAKIMVDTNGDNKTDVVFSGEVESALKEAKIINWDEVFFKPKDNIYRFKRELGIKPDAIWRYIQDGENLVLQTQIKIVSADMQVVKFFVLPDSPDIRVDLGLKKSRFSPRHKIPFENLRPRWEKREDLHVLTLDLASVLKDIPRDKLIYIEPIIYIKTSKKAFFESPPLKRIVFYRKDASEFKRSTISPVTSEHGQDARLDFDLEAGLEELGIFDEGRIINVTVNASIQGPQVVELKDVLVGDLVKKELPVILDQPARELENFIGRKAHFLDKEKVIFKMQPLFYREVQDCKSFDLIQNKYVVQGQLYAFSTARSGKISGQRVNINIDYLSPTKEKRKRLKIALPLNNVTVPLELPKQAIVNGITLDTRWIKDGINASIAFFDLVIKEVKEDPDYRHACWWEKEAVLPLLPELPESGVILNNEKVFIWTDQVRTLNFLLPREEFFKPLQFYLTHDNPFLLSELKNVKKSIPILGGHNELAGINISRDASLTIDYTGQQRLLSFDIPRLKVFGLRRTPKEILADLVIRLDDQPSPLSFVKLPRPEGEWIELGTIAIKHGYHTISVSSADFFSVKSLVFEAKGYHNFPRQDNPLTRQKDSFSGRIISLFMKLLILALGIVVLYRFRAFWLKAFQIMTASIRKFYWSLPEKWLFFTWLFSALFLYTLGVLIATGRENYGFTCGSIALVFAYWHLERLLRPWMERKYPKISEYVYRGRGTPFFAGAIILLALTAFLLTFGLDPLAEQVAIIVYYCLVVGVVGEICDLRKEAESD
ncbi:hypothetical protein KFV02_10535 [Desulfohalobiaceae bacterium Ax17]|uniref:hypothetical protein n=1 Tax=Desulfovulcanus ferrireducens TaxID=2831190 RepID=UPI00207BA5AF|nr:hypothetical protein [Desulfovulcanus ferrireducens]MBT8764370.1 hypothetical protein [Desulfovulcanus ferrireducens]